MHSIRLILTTLLWIRYVDFSKCEDEMRCKYPDVPKNGKVNLLSEIPSVGSIVTYSCDDGFILVGSVTSKCLSSGHWTFLPPECRASCGPPRVIDKASFSPKDISEFVVGTVLTYTCDFGYVSNLAFSTIECVSNDGSGDAYWTNTNLDCIPRSCGDPGTLNNGHVIGSIFTFPSNVTYRCNKGYVLHGQSVSFCQITGQWSGRFPICKKIQCDEPSQITNGKVYYDSLEYGSKIIYECSSGFLLNGLQNLICNDEGKWDGETPICSEMRCKYPDVPKHGNVNLPSEIPSVGSTAFYSCDDGFTLVGSVTSKCLSSGNWTFPPPKCREICFAPEIENGNLFYYQYRRYGDQEVKIQRGSKIEDNWKVHLKCMEGYFIVGRASTETEVICSDGKWTPTLTCVEASCKAKHPEAPFATLRIRKTAPGTVLWYSCHPNYYKAKPGNVTCNYGEWIGDIPICKDGRCYLDDNTFVGLKLPASRKFFSNQRLAVSCEIGYEITKKENGRLKCFQGDWKGAVPPCLPRTVNCIKPPPRVENGEIGNFSFIHGSEVHYLCNDNYILKQSLDPVTCQNGKWIGEVPKCIDKSCTVTNVQNGLFMFQTIEKAGHSPSDVTTYKQVRLNARENSGSTLYIYCEEPYIFNGRDSAEFVKVTCDNGQWNPKPLCLKREANSLNVQTSTSASETVSETAQITSGEKAATRAATLEEDLLQTPTSSTKNIPAVTTEKTEECFCIYNIKDEYLLAFSNEKLIKFGDKIKKGCTLQFGCDKFGYLRLNGVSELKCSNCNWHSSQFPNCVVPKQGDPLVQIVSNRKKDLRIGPGGKLFVPLKEDIKIYCGSSFFYPILTGPQGELRQTYHYASEMYFTISSTTNIDSSFSGIYTCSVKEIQSHFEFAFEVEVEKCPEFPENNDVIIVYENEREVYSKAKFSCRTEEMVVKGQSETLCLPGGKWSVSVPKCELSVWCPDLKETEGLTISYSDNLEVNSIASFHCIEPYRRLGSTHVICISNGEWSGPVATCTIPSCSIESLFTALPLFANVLGLDDVTTATVPHGTTLKMVCQENNHHMIGNPAIECHTNGSWSFEEIKCIPGCVSEKNLKNSTLIISPLKNRYKLGDLVLFSCPSGQTLTSDVVRAMCLPSGWSNQFPECHDTI